MTTLIPSYCRLLLFLPMFRCDSGDPGLAVKVCQSHYLSPNYNPTPLSEIFRLEYTGTIVRVNIRGKGGSGIVTAFVGGDDGMPLASLVAHGKAAAAGKGLLQLRKPLRQLLAH